MAAVAREVAEAEVTRWLDYKKISPRQREANADNVETIIDAICDGILVVDNECRMVQTLNFPVESEAPVTTLHFKPRVRMEAIHTRMQGVKGTDIDGRIMALISAVTGQPKDVIRSLDTGDYRIGQAIVIFFL